MHLHIILTSGAGGKNETGYKPRVRSSFDSQGSSLPLLRLTRLIDGTSGQPFKLLGFSSHWQRVILLSAALHLHGQRPEKIPCILSPVYPKRPEDLGAKDTEALNTVSTKSSRPKKPWDRAQHRKVGIYLAAGFSVPSSVFYFYLSIITLPGDSHGQRSSVAYSPWVAAS